MRDPQTNMEDMDRIGRRSVLACPECHGVMWEIDEGELQRYRCHTGHAYTAELLSVALENGLRHALASAERALEERLTLTRSLHRQSEEARHLASAANWAGRVTEIEEELNTLRTAMRRVEDLKADLIRKETEHMGETNTGTS